MGNPVEGSRWVSKKISLATAAIFESTPPTKDHVVAWRDRCLCYVTGYKTLAGRILIAVHSVISLRISSNQDAVCLYIGKARSLGMRWYVRSRGPPIHQYTSFQIYAGYNFLKATWCCSQFKVVHFTWHIDSMTSDCFLLEKRFFDSQCFSAAFR